MNAIVRITLVMTDRQHTNSIIKDAIENAIREALQRSLSTTMRVWRKEGRVRADDFEHSLDFLEELIAQSIATLIIPIADLIDLAVDRAMEAKSHARRWAK